MIAAFTINGGVKLYGREEKCSDRWADYPIRAMIILLSLIFTSTRLRNICHVLWRSEDCQCVLVFSACKWRLLQREQNGLISAKSLFQKILADVRAFSSFWRRADLHSFFPWSIAWPLVSSMRITRPPYKGISHSLMQSATNHVQPRIWSVWPCSPGV